MINSYFSEMPGMWADLCKFQSALFKSPVFLNALELLFGKKP